VAVEDWRLRPDEVALVLRRAAELDAALPAGTVGGTLEPFDGVDETAVIEAAEEAGFTHTSVSTALAELRAGALAELPPTGLLVDQRVVPGHAPLVARTVERLLDRERFFVRRRDGDRFVWARGPRSWSDSLRLRRGPGLGALDEVTVCVAAVPGESRTLVRLESAHRVDPTDAPVAGALGGGLGLTGGASLWAVSGDLAWLAASVPVAGVLALWRWREARREALRQSSEVADALSRLLDAVDRR
jgi:8-oxo-dGTP pyrophosphatase MutT (NUDIX family)